MHNNCNALEFSENHPPHFVEKQSSMKPVLGTKKLGDTSPSFFGGERGGLQCRFLPTPPVFRSPYYSVLKSPLSQLNLGHYQMSHVGESNAHNYYSPPTFLFPYIPTIWPIYTFKTSLMNSCQNVKSCYLGPFLWTSGLLSYEILHLPHCSSLTPNSNLFQPNLASLFCPLPSVFQAFCFHH